MTTGRINQVAFFNRHRNKHEPDNAKRLWFNAAAIIIRVKGVRFKRSMVKTPTPIRFSKSKSTSFAYGPQKPNERL